MADRAFLETLSRRLADEGKLIEAGWVAMRLHAVPLNAPAIQLDNMRMAFMGGAQHLFFSIMTILDPGSEPTDADMQRMSQIAAELDSYGEELVLRLGTKGSA